MRILVFSASITQGLWDSEGGWVARIRKFYDRQKISAMHGDPPTVFNLGVSGDMSSDVAKRFDAETQARIWPGEEFLFIFSVGTNNARETNGQLETTLEEYQQGLQTIIQMSRKYSQKTLFVGLPACDEQLTTPVSWRDIDYRNVNIQAIEQVMQNVATKENIPFVPIFETFKQQIDEGRKLLLDGLHPNNEGHGLIANLVIPEIEKMLKV